MTELTLAPDAPDADAASPDATASELEATRELLADALRQRGLVGAEAKEALSDLADRVLQSRGGAKVY